MHISRCCSICCNKGVYFDQTLTFPEVKVVRVKVPLFFGFLQYFTYFLPFEKKLSKKSWNSYRLEGVLILGTVFAANLKTASMILFFSIMTMFFALIFLTSKEKINPKKKEINLFFRIVLGFSSGFLSAPMGIGGGIINTPILKMFGYSINKAIGSSAAIGFLIAFVGAVGFIITGSYLNIEAPLSLGFVNIPAFLIFVPITMFMAKIGAKTVHKVDRKLIGKMFGIFLLIVSCRLFYEYFSF